MTGLDEALLRDSFKAQMPGQSESCNFDVFTELPSTNRFLMDHVRSHPDKAAQLRVCATAVQTAGVGRRGSDWVSGPECITFSILQVLPIGPAQIAGLSLVTGLAIADALQPLCDEQLQLKWPNDLMVGPAKLCGVLTELPKLNDQQVTVVTGIGVNYRHDSHHQQLERPYTTLLDLAADMKQGEATMLAAREELIGRIAASVVQAHGQFASKGWQHFSVAFEARDYLKGKSVRIEQGNEFIFGIARGVDASGALELAVDGEIRSFAAGEVTIGHHGLMEN